MKIKLIVIILYKKILRLFDLKNFIIFIFKFRLKNNVLFKK